MLTAAAVATMLGLSRGSSTTGAHASASEREGKARRH